MNTRLLVVAGMLSVFASGLFTGKQYPDLVIPLLVVLVLLVFVLVLESFNLWSRVFVGKTKKRLPRRRR